MEGDVGVVKPGWRGGGARSDGEHGAARAAARGARGLTRSDCGHLHISKDDCLSPSNPKGPGCCWEPDSKTVGGPQCYRCSTLVPKDLTVSFPAGNTGAGQCWTVADLMGVPPTIIGAHLRKTRVVG